MSDQIGQMRKGTTKVAILKLLADAEGPLHGYEMKRRLEALSDGFFRFREGLIYPALHRMEREGLLKSRWVEGTGARQRRVYSLTPRGYQALAAELEQWRIFAGHLIRLLGLQVRPGSENVESADTAPET
jgi:DNA-binding PadR family transcriptional regulator